MTGGHKMRGVLQVVGAGLKYQNGILKSGRRVGGGE